MGNAGACIQWKPDGETLWGRDFILAPEFGAGWMSCRNFASGLNLTLADFCLRRRAHFSLHLEERVVGLSCYLSGSVHCRFPAWEETLTLRGGDAGIFCLAAQQGEGAADPCRTVLAELRLSDFFLYRLEGEAKAVLTGGEKGVRVLPISPGSAVIAGDLFSCPYTGVAREFFWEAKALELLAHTLSGAEATVSDDLFAMRAARDRLVREMADPPDLRELARQAGLSRTCFAERFRELFGMPPFAYLRERRMEAARALLLSGSVNVTEAALAVGYASLSHFARAFRERFGVLPSSL
ncbi:helix-turn-helix transcriptional regulator [Desulfobotulus sp. H1]|uniref:Helix-turn-helix transcriptional regulator n=1 Tax=Desulfobotulus pelophilus TaxID=2823377 RepID=A0ABT3N7N6_9BACT|nr:helix-turn-helix transcriptional regulator [Desulfobotulus pelophilus]MCW7753473.1 helix-turn-helix transcriptional regulator [Desulfobotulus pelophilus]